MCFFKTISVNWVVNYSYLAIRLERSASFVSLIRLYVNSRRYLLFGGGRMQHAALAPQNNNKKGGGEKKPPIWMAFFLGKDLKDFKDFKVVKVVKDYSSLVQLVLSMRRYER